MDKLREKIDLFFTDELKEIEKQIENPQNERVYAKNSDTVRMIEFLNTELIRLKKLRSFFIYKLENQIQYPQSETILEQQFSELALVKDDLLPKVCRDNSIINEQLGRIFDKAFS